MHPNDLKIMLRNLWRNKMYSLINILGLSIGIASIIWGIQNYRYSRSYDNFHSQRGQVYRILSKHETRPVQLGIVPFPMAVQATREFASIDNFVRILSRNLDLKTDGAEAFSTRVHFTDQSFFKLFDFPLVAGNNDFSSGPHAVITDKTAKKLFGNENAVGKTITLYSASEYRIPVTVTGIVKELPMNSTIVFDVLCDLRQYRKPDGALLNDDDWSFFTDAAFIRIANPADAARLKNDFNRYIPHQNEVRHDFKLVGFNLHSMAELALLGSREIDNNSLYEPPEDSAAIGPLALAILILLSACLNFANTTVARSNRRLKEMGIRKVMGSSQAAIIRQQLFECSFIVLIAIALSMVINSWWLPEFNAMFVFISAQANYLTDPILQLILILVLIGVTLLAGTYPAFYISRFNATEIFRGSVKFGGSNLFSRILLGLQIMISFITVIAGAGFYRNAEFLKNYDYGYTKDNVFGISISDSSEFEPLYNEISKVPGITALSGTRHHIGFAYRQITFEAKGLKKQSIYMEVGADYPRTMELEVIAGRDFDSSREADYQQSLLITENFAFQFGWKNEEALGKMIRIDTAEYAVLGIMKDFYPNNFFDPVHPIALRMVKPSKFANLVVKADRPHLNSAYDQSRAIWKRLFPLKPFNGYYQDEVSAEASRVNASIAKIFFWFAIVSVLLTATGFFALISLTLLKKMREIAIRKIVGASIKDIVVIMNKGYFWVFLGSSVIGCYAGVMLTRLLMNAVFRINNGVNMGVVWFSFATVLMITALTVAVKVREAVVTKPVDVLKAE